MLCPNSLGKQKKKYCYHTKYRAVTKDIRKVIIFKKARILRKLIEIRLLIRVYYLNTLQFFGSAVCSLNNDSNNNNEI